MHSAFLRLAGLLGFISAFFVASPAQAQLIEYPQYLAVRMTGGTPKDTPQNRSRCLWPAELPFIGNDTTCALMDFGAVTTMLLPPPPAVPLSAEVRRRIWTLAFDAVRRDVLAGAPEAEGRKLAVMVVLALFHVPIDDLWKLEVFLDDLLYASRIARMPLILNFDTVSADGSARADVWSSTDNLERTYSGEIVRVSWRNWGDQHRIPAALNLASPGVQNAVASILFDLLPHVSEHYLSLAPEDRYLFGGIVFGMEMSIGVNQYFYAGGNAFAGVTSDPPGCDPGLLRTNEVVCPSDPAPAGVCWQYHRNQCPPDFETGKLNGGRGLEQIGYAAARQLNLLEPNQRMTREALDGIIRSWIGMLNHIARWAGVPTHKITAHVGGIYSETSTHSPGVGRLASVVPGWSLYGPDATNPGELVGSYLSSGSGLGLPWGSPEWRSGGATWIEWQRDIENTATLGNNRMVVLANWNAGDVVSSISRNLNALFALRSALNAPRSDSCVISPVIDLGHAVFRNAQGGVRGVGIRFSRTPPTAGAVFLNISSSSALRSDGALELVDIANRNVTSNASTIVTHPYTGRAYVQLVTDGCNAFGAPAMRIFSPVVPIDMVAGVGGTVPVPRLFTRVEGRHATLSWDIGRILDAAHEEYLNVSTDPTFATIDTVNLRVSRSDFYSTGVTSGRVYYARLVRDVQTRSGAVVRSISNIETLRP